MWKLNHFLSGDDEEREESFLEEESDGLCSLSPTQVCFSNSTSNLVSFLIIKFSYFFNFLKPFGCQGFCLCRECMHLLLLWSLVWLLCFWYVGLKFIFLFVVGLY
jgi:hypothetical protein